MPAATASIKLLANVNDLDVGIELGFRNLAADVVELNAGLEDATNLTTSVDRVVAEAQPITQAASTVPVGPLSALEKVSKTLKTVHRVTKNEVLPVLRDIAAIVGVIAGILAVHSSTPNRLSAKKSRAQLISEADSINQQIIEKFGTRIPENVAICIQRIENATTKLRSHLDEAAMQKLEALRVGLARFEPITHVLETFHPIRKIIHDIEGTVRASLSMGSKFIAPLKKAINAFNDYGKWAKKRIEDALNKAGIDIGFIHTLERQIETMERKIIDAILSPFKSLAKTAEDQLKAMTAPLEAAVDQYHHLKALIDRELQPVDGLL